MKYYNPSGHFDNEEQEAEYAQHQDESEEFEKKQAEQNEAEWNNIQKEKDRPKEWFNNLLKQPSLNEIKKDFDYDGYDNGKNLFRDIEKLIKAAFIYGYLSTGVMALTPFNEWESEMENVWEENKNKFIG